MIRLASATDPVGAAWAAFDAAAINFHRMYAKADHVLESDAERVARLKAAQETVRLWDEWRKLYLRDQSGDSA